MQLKLKLSERLLCTVAELNVYHFACKMVWAFINYTHQIVEDWPCTVVVLLWFFILIVSIKVFDLIEGDLLWSKQCGQIVDLLRIPDTVITVIMYWRICHNLKSTLRSIRAVLTQAYFLRLGQKQHLWFLTWFPH